MPFKDLTYRRLKAREYTAAYRKRIKLVNKITDEANPNNLARFCLLCLIDISKKKKNAKFCCRKHKNIFNSQKRDYAASYRKNIANKRAKALEYYHANIEKLRAKQRLYQQQNKPKYAANSAKRRASKLLRTPKWLTKQEFNAITNFYRLAKQQTVQTGVNWHVDHIIPLQGSFVSGLHVPWNLQLLPATDNIAKHNRHEAA